MSRDSCTQLSAFLVCPRRYRYQYLEGWQESQTRAAMLFGRTFEQALRAFFLGLDWRETWEQKWWAVRDLPRVYSPGESRESMLDQGYDMLEQQKRTLGGEQHANELGIQTAP